MADLSYVQVAADATGKRLRTTLVEDSASTMHQEIMVVAGGTGAIWEPFLDTIATSSANAMPVRAVAAASSVILGAVYVPNNVNVSLLTSPIDVQQVGATPWGVTHSSSLTWNIQMSTAVNGAYIDPRDRNWSISTGERLAVVGTGSSAVLGTVLSATGLAGAAIDPRLVTLQTGTTTLVGGVQLAPGSTATTIGSVGLLEGSSGNDLGVTMISTGFGTAAIDVRQNTIVAATSGAGLGVILSTGVGGAAIDPRVTSGAGSSGVTGTTLISTALAGAAIDPRQVTLQAGSTGTTIGSVALLAGTSGNTVGNVTVSTGSVALYSSTGGAIAVSTQTLSTDAMGFAVRVAAATTATTIGAVVISTAAGGLRGYLDSTSPNQLYFWTTGIAAAAAATMQSFNRTANLTSGTSGTSFNVAAGRIFRIDNVNGSIRLTSGTDLYADFAIRAVTTTGGATGTNFPVFYHRLAAAVAESTNALAVGGGGANFSMTGLAIDLPSSASFGVSIVSNSTASQECTFAFGGKEYLI